MHKLFLNKYEVCKLSNEIGNVTSVATLRRRDLEGRDSCTGYNTFKNHHYLTCQLLDIYGVLLGWRTANCLGEGQLIGQLIGSKNARPVRPTPTEIHSCWLGTVTLKRTRFESVEAVKAKATEVLNQLTEADFQHCFQQCTYPLQDQDGFTVSGTESLLLGNIEYEQWCEFQRRMFVVVETKFIKKMSSLNKKLGFKRTKKYTPQKVVNIVENLSSQVFDKEELNLLNKGLKFGLPASGGALEEVVAGVECAIQHLPDSSRGIMVNIFNNMRERQWTLLGNPKDKINNNEKSGIYEISCKDCDQKYIGQTKRSILTRFKEHMAHLKYGRTEKSCVAQHAFDNNHRIDINNLKLIRNVTNSRQLDAFESLEIIKCNNSMNKDNGPIPTSPLFALIKKDGYGSVNRGNKFGINSAIDWT
ncbi:hypothetical protein NQ318_020980 [Aromia moschata]|uniref:GIY-YIG domain-containing protein n=1 Tax=Aromia moschata TaxID=1265417 RepID=A0AAV8YLK5_9CUCU|nr:hypothetical protein NQ318_020980 [Aromia moschata]